MRVFALLTMTTTGQRSTRTGSFQPFSPWLRSRLPLPARSSHRIRCYSVGRRPGPQTEQSRSYSGPASRVPRPLRQVGTTNTFSTVGSNAAPSPSSRCCSVCVSTPRSTATIHTSFVIKSLVDDLAIFPPTDRDLRHLNPAYAFECHVHRPLAKRDVVAHALGQKASAVPGFN